MALLLMPGIIAFLWLSDALCNLLPCLLLFTLLSGSHLLQYLKAHNTAVWTVKLVIYQVCDVRLHSQSTCCRSLSSGPRLAMWHCSK
jgi:hypothetical protein